MAGTRRAMTWRVTKLSFLWQPAWPAMPLPNSGRIVISSANDRGRYSTIRRAIRPAVRRDGAVDPGQPAMGFSDRAERYHADDPGRRLHRAAGAFRVRQDHVSPD